MWLCLQANSLGCCHPPMLLLLQDAVPPCDPRAQQHGFLLHPLQSAAKGHGG